MPKVSVIIPTRNRPDLLDRAIASVLGQTESDFEVLVVDDGSPDRAAEGVIRCRHDERLHYIRLPVSRGPAAARNAGIVRATAPYVAFLDDDDEWLPEKLRRQTATIDRMNLAVGGLYTARLTVDEANRKVTMDRPSVRFDPVNHGNIITTSSVLLRRACFDAVGLFDEDLSGIEDFDMWIRVDEKFRFEYIDEPLVKYHLHHGGMSDRHHTIALAMERFLIKHRQMIKRNHRRYCLLHVWLGQRYGLAGDVSRARAAFRRAILLWPFEPEGYLRLALSFVGSGRVWR